MASRSDTQTAEQLEADIERVQRAVRDFLLTSGLLKSASPLALLYGLVGLPQFLDLESIWLASNTTSASPSLATYASFSSQKEE